MVRYLGEDSCKAPSSTLKIFTVHFVHSSSPIRSVIGILFYSPSLRLFFGLQLLRPFTFINLPRPNLSLGALTLVHSITLLLAMLFSKFAVVPLVAAFAGNALARPALAARQVQSTSLLANFDPATALVNPDPLTAATPVPNANANTNNVNNNIVENANVAAPPAVTVTVTAPAVADATPAPVAVDAAAAPAAAPAVADAAAAPAAAIGGIAAPIVNAIVSAVAPAVQAAAPAAASAAAPAATAAADKNARVKEFLTGGAGLLTKLLGLSI